MQTKQELSDTLVAQGIGHDARGACSRLRKPQADQRIEHAPAVTSEELPSSPSLTTSISHVLLSNGVVQHALCYRLIARFTLPQKLTKQGFLKLSLTLCLASSENAL